MSKPSLPILFQFERDATLGHWDSLAPDQVNEVAWKLLHFTLNFVSQIRTAYNNQGLISAKIELTELLSLVLRSGVCYQPARYEYLSKDKQDWIVSLQAPDASQMSGVILPVSDVMLSLKHVRYGDAGGFILDYEVGFDKEQEFFGNTSKKFAGCLMYDAANPLLSKLVLNNETGFFLGGEFIETQLVYELGEESQVNWKRDYVIRSVGPIQNLT